MTVIAYAQGVIAGDSGLYSGNDVRMGSEVKVRRSPDGCLWSTAGSLSAALVFDDWMERGRPSRHPVHDMQLGDHESFESLVVEPSGTIRHYEMSSQRRGMLSWVNHQGYAAIGRGATAALAVLSLGLSAMEAVTAAGNVVSLCGGPYHTIRLDEGKTGGKRRR